MSTVPKTQTRDDVWETLKEKLGLKETRTSEVHSASTGWNSQKLLAPCGDGERTAHLTGLAGSYLARGFNVDQVIEHCLMWNERNTPPLGVEKIISTCKSIAATDARNHPERTLGQGHAFGLMQTRIPPTPLFDLQAGRIDRYLQTPPPARRWLIKDLVVLGKVGAIVAPGGSSKSQWLLQLAVGVSTGLAVADHWEVGEPGSVIVFFAEDDDDEIHRRIKRIQEHLQLAGQGNQLATLPERLYIFSTIGTPTLLTKRDQSGEVLTTVVVQEIAAMAAQLPDLRLIVIDPASRFRGGEENSNEDATRFVEALETLAKTTGATVLIAHHTNKGSYNPDVDPGQGASRGASALTDGLRWQMNLNGLSTKQLGAIGANKEDLRRFVAATVTKTNYSAIPAAVILERGNDGYLTAVTPAQAQQRADQQAIMRVLQVLNRIGAVATRALEETYGGVGNVLKMPKQHVRDVVKLAVARGFLTGGDRQPLKISDAGAVMAKCFPEPAEIATLADKPAPRKKSQ